MNRKTILVGFALTALLAAGSTAEATGLIHTANIAKGAVTMNRLAPNVQKQIMLKRIPGPVGPQGPSGTVVGVPGAVGATGAKGADGRDGKDGAAAAKGDTGATGPAGLPGANGTNGVKGDKGDKGDTGAKGADGTNGHDGTNGVDAPARQYGAVKVLVARNGGFASTWATYSTALGSPYGDTTGGTFRFTCSGTVNCEISVQASITAGASHGFYPRLLVYKSGPTGDAGSISECEYADGGVTNVSLPGTPVTLNIGGSADCLAQPVLPIGNGDVSTIVVPAGNYYDVLSTFTFLP